MIVRIIIAIIKNLKFKKIRDPYKREVSDFFKVTHSHTN